MPDNPLETQSIDRTAAVVRGVVGAVPVIGPLVAEVLVGVIPGQKLDRLEQWLKLFSTRVSSLEEGIERLRARLRTPEGADILEDCLLEASRALSTERLDRLARILANGLADEEFAHDRLKTLARLFGSLTDSEFVLLMFYAKVPSFDSPWHKAMIEKHPAVLRPVSRSLGMPKSDIDLAALHDHRTDTLLRLGLLTTEGKSTKITSLGKLLLRHAVDDGEFFDE